MNKGQQPHRVNVVGAGQANFDARQKLSRKQNKGPVQHVNFAPKQQDKGKFDVRERIQTLKRTGAQGQFRKHAPRITAPGSRGESQQVIPRIRPPGANGMQQDVRIKIKYSQNKPMDARLMIKSRQQNRNPGQVKGQIHRQAPGVALNQVAQGQNSFQNNPPQWQPAQPPQVMVTGIGRVVNQQGGSGQQMYQAAVAGVLAQGGGSIQRTIASDTRQNQQQNPQQNPPNVQRNLPIKKTVST